MKGGLWSRRFLRPQRLRALAVATASVAGSTWVAVSALTPAHVAANGPTAQCNSGNTPYKYQQDSMHMWNIDNDDWADHGWLIDWGDNCDYSSFSAGEDARWSWGGDWHNVTTLGLSVNEKDCDGLHESQNGSYSQKAYQAFDLSEEQLYDQQGDCKHVATASGTYDEPNVYHWTWTLNVNRPLQSHN